MKSTITIAAALALFAGAAAASENAPKAHSQQEKFAHCSHESKGLKSDERHKFMSECLKSHAHDDKAKHEPVAVKEAHNAPAHHDQQGRMKACNDEAGKKNLHGDERRAFMSACLKG